MRTIIVAGCGTDVGKTVISAILVQALSADYWKPIQSGGNSDLLTIKNLVPHSFIHPSLYTFQNPLSPHHAARLEGVEMQLDQVVQPKTENALVVEMAGGVCVPLNDNYLSIDFFIRFEAEWIVVSSHYLGSINHTLLTLEALKRRGLTPQIVFNGDPNPDSEKAILHYSGCPALGRIKKHTVIDSNLIRRYACQLFGTLLPKC